MTRLLKLWKCLQHCFTHFHEDITIVCFLVLSQHQYSRKALLGTYLRIWIFRQWRWSLLPYIMCLTVCWCKFCWWFTDGGLVQKACSILVGHHDFSSFRAAGCQVILSFLTIVSTLCYLSINCMELVKKCVLGAGMLYVLGLYLGLRRHPTVGTFHFSTALLQPHW